MDQEKISNFIKKIRKENNLTQKDLADKYNITYQAVSKWENGINMPDTLLLKKMSKDFNISLDDIFEGEYSKKKTIKRKILLFSLLFLIIVFVIVLVFILFNNKDNNSFEFKTLSSSCSNFKVTGSIAYNKNKSSIYISDVNYCGGDDLEEYSNIECSLFEKEKDKTIEIDKTAYKGKKISLEEFLKTLSFKEDNYSRMCKDYINNSIYLEIKAYNSADKITIYKIPLVLKSECN